jgi:hypothetical protein
MRNGQLVLVACRLHKGAFSGERVFRLPMAGSRDDYIGIAPVSHCFDEDLKPLGRNEPPGDSEIDGFIEAYLISNGGSEARVELPDGEAIRIPTSRVSHQRETGRGSAYVPVGS